MSWNQLASKLKVGIIEVFCTPSGTSLSKGTLKLKYKNEEKKKKTRLKYIYVAKHWLFSERHTVELFSKH